MTHRPNPFEELERLFDRLSDQFEDVDQLRSIESKLPGGPKVDVADFGDAFEVTADLPGFETEDITVELIGEELHVVAKTETESEAEEPGRYIRRERSERSVDRRITLPEPVAEENVEATFQNGVLTVCLPKQVEASETHEIDVE